jgi:SagB-type dehydrogenase family enzyme
MPITAGQQFMCESRLECLGPSEQEQGLPQPPLELPYTGETAPIQLPHPAELDLGHVDLRAAIEGRKTLRRYSDQSLTLDELTFQLWCSQGVKRVTSRPATSRMVPSAGARHAFETELLVNRVEGLPSGLYRYLAIENQLVALDLAPDINERITHACQEQNHIRTSAVTFIWVAVLARMRWRYGQRGYRYLHLDAGHVCQNLSLAAEATGCGICPIAAFNDDLLNGVLGLDGEEQFAIYMASLGKKG